MLVHSFRLPGSDTATASHALLDKANAVIDASKETKGNRLTANQLRQVHKPLQQLKERLEQASLHVDEIGENEAHKPDHVLLGYEAAAKAAQTRDDGTDRLAEFAPARQHASLEKNTGALNFLEEHAILPSALECSAVILRALDHLTAKLAPMPESALADQVIHRKNVLEKAHKDLASARKVYQDVQSGASVTFAQKNAALDNLDSAQDTVDEAENAYANLIEKPEIGEDRAAEILAAFPVSSTRKALADVVAARTHVLRGQSLPFFFDGIFVKQLEKQRDGRSAREIELAERLKKSGFSSTEIKQAVKEWRNHALHGLHGETLREHVSTGNQRLQDHVSTGNQHLQDHVSMTGEQMAEHVTHESNVQILRIAEIADEQTDEMLKAMTTQANLIIGETRRGMYCLAQLQTELHNSMRGHVLQQADRMIDASRGHAQQLMDLTHEQSGILVNALHAEADRCIVAGEHGLNHLRALTDQDQRARIREVHQQVAQVHSSPQNLSLAWKYMSRNDDKNERVGSRLRRFFADGMMHGWKNVIADRMRKSTVNYAVGAPPANRNGQPRLEPPRQIAEPSGSVPLRLELPHSNAVPSFTSTQTRIGQSLPSEVVQHVAAHEIAHEIEEVIHEHVDQPPLIEF